MPEPKSLSFTRANRRYGQWFVIERIGTGGMGEVFRARNETDGHQAALKFIGVKNVGDELNRKRFLREIRACSALQHPNIIKILGAGEEDDDIYLAMDLLKGDNLAWTVEDKGPLSLERAIAMALDILEALAYMHPRGFTHRDIKPSNIFLTDDGRHVLMDFGLVRVEGEGTLTIAGNVLGTPRYMAPEVMHGSIADKRGDLFQMGVVMYEALTREVPYQPVDHVKFARGDFSPRPLPVRHWNDQLPASIDVVLANALAAKPNERYARAEDFIDDLKRVLSGQEVTRVSDRPRARQGAVQLPNELALRFPNAELLEEEPGLNRFFSPGGSGDRPALIKVFSDRVCADAERVTRMRAELARLEALSHAHLVPPREIGLAAEKLFSIEDLPAGEPLARAAVKPQTFEEIVHLGIALCDALAPLHALGRPHGFVDPRTVRIQNRQLAALTDLEHLALHQIGRLSEVKDSTLKFSSFTAPEQLDGHPPTAAADVYAVGVLIAGLLGKSAEGPVKQVLHRATGAVAQRYPSVAAFKSALNGLIGSGKRSTLRPPNATPQAGIKPFDPAATEKIDQGAVSTPPPPRSVPPSREPAKTLAARPSVPPAGRPPVTMIVVAALVLGLIAAASFLMLRHRGPTREELSPSGLQIDSRPTEVSLAFTTPIAWSPAIEFGEPNGPLRLVRETGPPRTDHRFGLRGLNPGQTYRWRFVYPDGVRDGGGELKTPNVNLTQGAQVYSVLKVEQEFTTDQPVRCRVELTPRGRSAAPVPVLVEEQDSRRHLVSAGLVVPGEACTLKVLLLRSEGDPLLIAEWPVASLSERLDALGQQLTDIQPEPIVQALVKAKNAGAPPDQLAAQATRTIARSRAALDSLIGMGQVLAEDAVGLSEKLRLYRMLAPLIQLDAGCDFLGVPFSTGASRALPPSFRAAAMAPMNRERAQVKEIKLPGPKEPFVPQGSALGLLENGLPKGSVAKFEATRRFTMTGVGSVKKAALFLPAQEFDAQFAPELFFTVSLNQQVPLLLRYDVNAAHKQIPPDGLTHTFDPRLLAEGSNELTVRLIQIPGLVAPMGRVALSKIQILTWTE